MALDLDLYRQKLLDRRAELQLEDESVVADRAPVALDQESVGRLSRIDAMQVQAMALAQQRRRQSERNANDAALLRFDEDAFRSAEQTSELQSLMRSPYTVSSL